MGVVVVALAVIAATLGLSLHTLYRMRHGGPLKTARGQLSKDSNPLMWRVTALAALFLAAMCGLMLFTLIPGLISELMAPNR